MRSPEELFRGAETLPRFPRPAFTLNQVDRPRHIGPHRGVSTLARVQARGSHHATLARMAARARTRKR